MSKTPPLVAQEDLRADNARLTADLKRVELVAPNQLEQNFSVDAPDRVWTTDINYIRTFEGWPYMAVVVNPYSQMCSTTSRFSTTGFSGTVTSVR